MPFGGLLSAGVSIGSSLFGASQADKERKAEENIRRQAVAQFSGIDIPTIEGQKLNLETAGLDYLPSHMEQALELGPSAYGGIDLPPELAQAQAAALSGMQERATEGMTDVEKAALGDIRRGSAREAEAKQQQILQEMQARGAGGAGQELAARLQAAQSGADRQSQEGMALAGMMEQARRAALQQSGQLATGMRTQEFGEEAQKAGASDAISRFNVQNQQSVGQRNVAQQNLIEELRQKKAEEQVAVANAQQKYNKELQQQEYENKLKKAAGATGQMSAQAGAHGSSADRKAQQGVDIGKGLASAVGTATDYFSKPEKKADDWSSAISNIGKA